MNLLHLDSSILGRDSVSRSLSSHAVEQLRRRLPNLRVTYRDLAAEPIPHLSGDYLAAMGGGSDTVRGHASSEDLALGHAVMQEFLSADIVVIGVAFYNFSISSQLKAWIDRIVVAGKTFRYAESGRVQGLAGGKRIFLAIARGGCYGNGSSIQWMEHAETYLRCAFSLIGVIHLEVVVAEGLKMGAQQRQAAIAHAEHQITQAMAGFSPCKTRETGA